MSISPTPNTNLWGSFVAIFHKKPEIKKPEKDPVDEMEGRILEPVKQDCYCKTNPIYNDFFLYHSSKPLETGWRDYWKKFMTPRLTEEEQDRGRVKDQVTVPLSERVVGFSMNDKNRCERNAKKAATLAAKIIFFPWGICSAIKFTVKRHIMDRFYPAQSSKMKKLDQSLSPEYLDKKRVELADNLAKTDYIFRDEVLEKNGVRYNAFVIGHKDHINNGKWAIQATGNREPIEHIAEQVAKTYHTRRCNVLLVNGPSVGRSKGIASPETMGDAQEVGIAFLETAIKAKEILMAGRSLGGAAIGLAIMKHRFKTDKISYAAVFQMTFDRASNIVKKIANKGCLQRIVARWCEMDTVAASVKLQKLGIPQIVANTTGKELQDTKDLPPNPDAYKSDGIIVKEAALGYRLLIEGKTRNVKFQDMRDESHNNSTVFEIAAKLGFRMTLSPFRK